MAQDLHLFTHEFYPFRGGIATYCHEFALAAAIDHSYKVTVHGPSSATAPEGQIKYTIKAGKHRGTHNLGCLLRSRQELQRALNKEGATYVLAEPGAILSYGLLCKTNKPNNLIVTLHGSEIQRWQKNPLARWMATRCFKDATIIIAVSNPIAALAKQVFPEFSQKIRAVCNALPRAFIQNPSNTELGSAEPTAANGTFKILSVGRLHPRKGYDQVIQAIAKLPQALKNKVNYTIVGGRSKSNYDQKLQILAARSDVQLSIKLDLSDTELIEHYKQADLFCLTSMPYRSSIEGFGIVYLEAGAYALPSLAYDTGGVRDAVIDNRTGKLIRAGDIDGLRQQLQNWVEDPAPLRELGEAARENALSRNWAEVVAESLELTSAS